jgi:hypothetical protein
VDKKRSIGVTILAVFMIIGGAISTISLPFYFIKMFGPEPQFSVEKYRELMLKGRQPTAEQLKEFETKVVLQFEKTMKVQKEISRNVTIALMQFIYLLTGVLALVFGIGLMRLQEDARQWTIIYQVVSSVVGIICQFTMMKIILGISAKYMPELYTGKGAPGMVYLPMAVGVCIVGLITWFIVSFLSRPSVKEQFA